MNDITTPESKTTVAYLRTKAAHRDDELSLESQWRACEDCAHKLGVQITVLYVDANLPRIAISMPGLEALFDDLSRRRVRYVITAEQTILTPYPPEAHTLERQITRTGATLITGQLNSN